MRAPFSVTPSLSVVGKPKIMASPSATINQTLGVHYHHHTTNILVFLLILSISIAYGQQPYFNNDQFLCSNNSTNTEGYTCNGPSSCNTSYLTFRSNPPYYTSVPSIAYLLSTSSSSIAAANNVTDVAVFPPNHLILIPLNCSCTSVYTSFNSTNNLLRRYYQHNATYTLKFQGETYLTIANDTYLGLTTCQAMIAQNPIDARRLVVGNRLVAPLMCACTTTNQTAKGFAYIVSYLTKVGDNISTISKLFGADEQDVLDANELSPGSTIYPYNPILVPLKSDPTKLNLNPTTAESPSPTPTESTPGGDGSSSSSNKKKKWLGIGVGIGIGATLLTVAVSAILFWMFCFASRRKADSSSSTAIGAAAGGLKKPNRDRRGANGNNKFSDAETAAYRAVPGVVVAGGSAATGNTTSTSRNSWSISSDGVRYAIESLTVYKFEELQRATGNFSETNRINGSVYRGYFNGDPAAVKIMKADVSAEINILKQINHSSIVRLSGFCVHGGNTYLVYEYAEKGSLRDWLLEEQNKKEFVVLGWKQRVQIAYDVADGLNYLHNYTNPPYIHKNLTSGNVLLDGNLRGKITNFGLARALGGSRNGNNNELLHLTMHVVGTQGYLAPEFVENGLITPKLDVYAFGIILAELLSGKVVSSSASASRKRDKDTGGEEAEQNEALTASSIRQLFEGDDMREKLRNFVDGAMGYEYPLDLAYSMAQLAKKCVETDVNSRPSIAEVLRVLSKIHSSSMDWDPSDNLESTSSINYGR